MATIYCSHKLSTLLGLPKKPSKPPTAVDEPNNWNGMLFYLNKRKCLLFVHKETLYAFLVLGIVKKDLAEFPKFFRQHFTDQLIADQLINPQTKSLLDSAYESITLQPTDNDKRVIGSMNDCIYRIKVYVSLNEDGLLASPTYIGHQLNKTPMGAISYDLPVRRMKEFLEKSV